MNQLVIKLTGTVDSSNFDEWRKGLVAQIQSANVDLVTDSDFITASRLVKSFKLAEESLKRAKQSAIDQAEEIQRLFSAIDEVTEETRRVRLSLARQIKARKLEIKNQYIQAGIDEIQRFIDEQVDEFKYIDTSIYLNRGRFEAAVKGKAGTRGLQNGIDRLCREIKREVSDRNAEITQNKIKIDALPRNYKLLFQDWKSLLSLSANELRLEIDKRIALYNEDIARQEAEKLASELKKLEDIELNPEKTITGKTEIPSKEKYRIIIDMLSTRDKAKEVARAIKNNYGSDPSVDSIKLTRNRDNEAK